MDKFSNLKIQKDEEVKDDTSKFKNDNFSVIDYNENDIILSKDEMIILPYLKDDGFILMKFQKTPAFSYKYKETHKDYEYFLSCIKGEVDEKDSDIQNVRKILYEETGLVLSTNVSIEVDKILFKNDTTSGQYYFCLLNLSYSDYKQTSLKTDDSSSDPKKVVKVSLGDLDEIKTFDLATDYMLLKFKYDINL